MEFILKTNQPSNQKMHNTVLLLKQYYLYLQ